MPLSKKQYNVPVVYAVKHKLDEIRMESRSGGIFTAVSDYILEDCGVIYGCILTSDFKAVHIRATKKDERNSMRGSKYIQSSLGETFKDVKKDLENGRKVLFSGTSCQVAGLHGFLQRDYDNLLCIDIVCHGVPSPKVWNSYLEWQEEKSDSKIKSVDFRNKKDFGWSSHIETLYLENGKKVNSEIFKTLFYDHYMLRPCCYKCPYKSIKHPGDITIADYWGIDKAAPGFNDNKGVSLVLINNAFGQFYYDTVNDNLEYRKCKLEDSMQPPLKAPFEEPKNRNEFWHDYNNKSFKYIAKKYGGYGLINFLKKCIRKFVDSLRKVKNKYLGDK